MASNEYEERARARKASELTSHFRARGVTADQISSMHPDVLAHHVGMAGIKNPSPETMAMVLRTVQHLEKRDIEHPDPFEGLLMAIRGRIFRGEVRQAFPTWRNPDPAQHAAEDPHDFLKTWMTPHYPYPEGYSGQAPTIGQHWTRSPEIIPERFVEPVTTQPQPGVPMGKSEQTAVSRREAVDMQHLTIPKYPSYDELPPYPAHNAPEEEHEEWQRASDAHSQRFEQAGRDIEQHHATMRKYESYLDRASREGRNTYADLSMHDQPPPGSARKYRMGIVWEAHTPEHFEHGTNYEDELDLPLGSKVHVTGARIFIPKAGTTPNLRERHPSVFTPEEHASANADAFHRSTYSHINPESSIPWSRVQFANSLEMPIERNRGYESR